MKQPFRIHFLFFLFFFFTLPSLWALDKIVLGDGTEIIVTVVNQTATEITYTTESGETLVILKQDVQSVNLDFDVDKFFIAAQNATDEASRLRLLERSVAFFPERLTNRVALAEIYLRDMDLDKAAETLGTISISEQGKIFQALNFLKSDDFTEYQEMLGSVNLAAIENDPELLSTYTVLNSLNPKNVGQLKKAVKNLKTVYENNPDSLELAFANITETYTLPQYINTLEDFQYNLRKGSALTATEQSNIQKFYRKDIQEAIDPNPLKDFLIDDDVLLLKRNQLLHLKFARLSGAVTLSLAPLTFTALLISVAPNVLDPETNTSGVFIGTDVFADDLFAYIAGAGVGVTLVFASLTFLNQGFLNTTQDQLKELASSVDLLGKDDGLVLAL